MYCSPGGRKNARRFKRNGIGQYDQTADIPDDDLNSDDQANKETGLTGLMTEAANSNGPETFGACDAAYQYSSKFAVRAVGDVRYYGASSRQEQGVPYTGRRVTLGSDAHIPDDIGAGFDYALELVNAFPQLEVGYFQQRRFVSLTGESS